MIVYTGKKDNLGLHILKLICAFFVVQIHFPSVAREMLDPLIRIAVPIFFMITGYFLIDKNGDIQTRRIKKTILKVLKLYLFVTLIYFLYNLTQIRSLDFFHQFTQPSFWFHFIFLGTRPGYHLWYLIALIEALLFIYVGIKLSMKNLIWVIIPLCLLLNIAFGKYNFIFSQWGIPESGILSRNAITFGVPFILIGVLIRQFEYKLPSYNWIVFAAIISIFGLYIEDAILQHYPRCKGDMICFVVPCAIFVMLTFLKSKNEHPLVIKTATIGKRYTSDIYVWHILISLIILRLIFPLKLHPDYAAFIVMIASLVCAITIHKLNLHKIYS